ncbi:acyltransferase [Neorhodopirellula lusitana]
MYLLGDERGFELASEKVSRVPGYRGNYARRVFYRYTLASVGQRVQLRFLTVFSKTKASIGDSVYIGRSCSIGWALIDDNALIADGVQITSGRHQHSQSTTARSDEDDAERFVPVKIGRGAWVGAGAIVMADVGPGAVVAAGAVVTKPIPAGAIVAGVPARALPEKSTENSQPTDS